MTNGWPLHKSCVNQMNFIECCQTVCCNCSEASTRKGVKLDGQLEFFKPQKLQSLLSCNSGVE